MLLELILFAIALIAIALFLVSYPIRLLVKSEEGWFAQLLWLPSFGVIYRPGHDWRQLTLRIANVHLPILPHHVFAFVKEKTKQEKKLEFKLETKKKDDFGKYILKNDPKLFYALTRIAIGNLNSVPDLLATYRVVVKVFPLEPETIIGAVFWQEMAPKSKIDIRFHFEPRTDWQFRVRISPLAFVFLGLAFVARFPYLRLIKLWRGFRESVGKEERAQQAAPLRFDNLIMQLLLTIAIEAADSYVMSDFYYE